VARFTIAGDYSQVFIVLDNKASNSQEIHGRKKLCSNYVGNKQKIANEPLRRKI